MMKTIFSNIDQTKSRSNENRSNGKSIKSKIDQTNERSSEKRLSQQLITFRTIKLKTIKNQTTKQPNKAALAGDRKRNACKTAKSETTGTKTVGVTKPRSDVKTHRGASARCPKTMISNLNIKKQKGSLWRPNGGRELRPVKEAGGCKVDRCHDLKLIVAV